MKKKKTLQMNLVYFLILNVLVLQLCVHYNIEDNIYIEDNNTPERIT